MGDDDLTLVEWTSESPTIDAAGYVVRQGDVAELSNARAEAHRRMGRCVYAESEPDDKIGFVPTDYDELRDLANDVAGLRGHELDSKDGEYLAQYLVDNGYEAGDKWL